MAKVPHTSKDCARRAICRIKKPNHWHRSWRVRDQKGIEYLVENVIDPNAVIGRDFQARIIVTREGRVITGLIEKETDSSITIRTLTESVTVAKSEIEETKISLNSFMPEGLLRNLNDREQIELFKFLMGQ